MLWSELWDSDNKPLNSQIEDYVDTPLWGDLADYLQRTYNAEPKLFYSCCTMDKGFWEGWNIKYKKNGKVLCTLYPKKRHLITLINIGAKESAEADLLIPLCDEYTKSLYTQTKSGTNGKSLAISVTSKSILCDVKNLVALRAGSHKI